jgi:hypothetical protein
MAEPMGSIFRIATLELQSLLVGKVLFCIIFHGPKGLIQLRTPLASAARLQEPIDGGKQLLMFLVDQCVAGFQGSRHLVRHSQLLLFSYKSLNLRKDLVRRAH